VPALTVRLLKRFDPVPLRVVVPAAPKKVVAPEVKFPATANDVPVKVKSEFAVSEFPAETMTLLKLTVPEPALEKIVVPPKVVALLPASSLPVPVRFRLPVRV
jgi:hypothetical protein